MFQYLEQFKQLPKDLQSVVSSPKAMKTIDELEEKYGVELDALAIKVMVKEISWGGLENFLAREHNLPREEAERLVKEMTDKIFFPARDYLGINALTPKPAAVAEPAEIKTPAPAPAAKVRTGEFKKVEKINLTSDELNQIMSGDTTVLTKPLAVSSVGREETEGGVGGSAVSAVDEIAIEAAGLAGIHQKDADRMRRLKNLLKTFIKGIRDRFDIEETLTKSFESGGLALNKEQAGQIIALAVQKRGFSRTQPAVSKRPRPAIDALLQVQDVDYDFNSFKKSTPAIKTAPVESRSFKELIIESQSRPDIGRKTKEDDSKGSPALAIKSAAKSGTFVISPERIREAEEKIASKRIVAAEKAGPPAPKEEKTFPVRVARPVAGAYKNKPRLDDIIKPESRPQGLTEELSNMDLINFRRLSDDPAAAAEKIKSKISLLEEESFTRRQQGVNSWQLSPLYRMYIDLGRESIERARPVEDIRKDKISGGAKDILTAEEFNAILNLNRQLRV